MKRTLMIGVAAGALLAGVNIAAAQGTMQQQPGASGGSGSSMEQPKSGAQQQKGSGGAEMKSDSPATSGQAPKQDTQKQDAQKQGDQQQDAKSGQAAGGGKTLSAEQKTKIRTTVISSGPRVTNVNFSVSVGTVVPRTVQFAPLHPILVEIYPEWRSYRFVIVEERIVIIDPSSFRIIAVLVV